MVNNTKVLINDNGYDDLNLIVAERKILQYVSKSTKVNLFINVFLSTTCFNKKFCKVKKCLFQFFTFQELYFLLKYIVDKKPFIFYRHNVPITIINLFKYNFNVVVFLVWEIFSYIFRFIQFDN